MTKIEQKHIFKNSFIRKDYSKNFRYLAAVAACLMAAIIAQLTLGNRERQKRALSNIGCTKCNYTLHPFHQNGFDPKVHNKYILERERYKKMYMEMGKEEHILQEKYKTILVSFKIC